MPLLAQWHLDHALQLQQLAPSAKSNETSQATILINTRGNAYAWYPQVFCEEEFVS